MKHLFTLLFLTFNVTLFSQSQNFAGDYEIKYNTSNAVIEYKLLLNLDGTFFFHSYENHTRATPPEKNQYAIGTREAKKNIIYFLTSEQEIDEKHTLNFTNSKARFTSKSPRDKSDKLIKTALKFLESDIPWIKGQDIYKKE